MTAEMRRGIDQIRDYLYGGGKATHAAGVTSHSKTES